MKNALKLMAILLIFSACEKQGVAETKIANWPPQEGIEYPDLEMVNSSGDKVKLSSFKGKVIVIKPIGMNCPACNAWAGGQEKGGFDGIRPQSNLESFDVYAKQRGVDLENDKIVIINLLLFNMNLKPTDSVDAKAWEEHFGFANSSNHIVLAGSDELLNSANYDASYKMVPGFHLVDKNFILRSDASGHHPKRNLYTHLIPKITKLLNER